MFVALISAMLIGFVKQVAQSRVNQESLCNLLPRLPFTCTSHRLSFRGWLVGISTRRYLPLAPGRHRKTFFDATSRAPFATAHVFGTDMSALWDMSMTTLRVRSFSAQILNLFHYILLGRIYHNVYLECIIRR